MYLKRLEMQGFKSFAEKTVMEFKPGITTVIGPNGSGKSNISDAIRWVLGEQSIKSLRGQSSSDVIFAGTENRKSLGFAEVSIILDNSDNKLPIEFNEVTVTRTLYRSGETGYFINRTPCRLKDVLELFMDTGIGKDGYSIIGQGKIDEILSNKSEDRRRIFEEAAGIVKYRTRKVEAEKKLEQTKLNLLRINDILTEIESNLGTLEEEATKAKKYLDYKEELKGIELGLFGYDIETLKVKLEEIDKDYEIYQGQYDDESKGQEEKTKLKEEIKKALEDIQVKIEEVQNLSFESGTKIEINNEKISNNEENSKRFNDEIIELEERIKLLEEEKEEKATRKGSLDSNKEKFEKELKEKEEEFAKISGSMTEEEKVIEDKKKIVEEDIDKKYEIANQISTIEANFENIDKRENQVKNEIRETISDLDNERTLRGEILQSYTNIEKEREKKVQTLEDAKKKIEGVDEKVSDIDRQITIKQDDMRMKISRRNFLIETEKEKEGYFKSVKSVLQKADQDAEVKKYVHGVLANLLSVPKEYQVAIEMTLGNSMQNIVTDKEEDAKKMIEFLRINKLGRASFMPISAVKGSKLIGINLNETGVIGIASDLVKFDSKYENVVNNLLGRTVVVDNMNNAINVAKKNKYSFRIVTLEGDLINPSGMMTGGSIQEKTVNILGRKSEISSLEKEIEKIQKEIEKLESEKTKILKDNEDVITFISDAEKALQEFDIANAGEKAKMDGFEANIERYEERKKKFEDELEKLKEERKGFEEEKAKLEDIINDITENVNKLNLEISEFQEKNKDKQQLIDDLNQDITNLKISVSSFDESKGSIEEMIERINQDIETNKTNIENRRSRIEEFKLENERLKAEIEEINKRVENSSSEIEELKEEKKNQNEKLEKVEEDIETSYKTLEKLKEEVVKIESKKIKLDQDLEQKVNELWEEYELTPSNLMVYERPSNIQESKKKVNSIKSEIKELGDVNVNAIETFKKTKERYDFMNTQRADLEETSTKLRKVIAEMLDTMKTQFSKNFSKINKNFNAVFSELFGGGEAELILEDEENILECGIDIRVRPEGKKLQSMSLLSGGERALTAIALLFAILKINPSPFCILDEIEAALDDVNVVRFANYLRKFSRDTEFLVITHRKGTMEVADTVYGITMEENGISKLLSMKLNVT